MSAIKRKIEFGDFQTPAELARDVCRLLSDRGARPTTVIEPTCGTGSFVIAAAEQFHSARHIVGAEVNDKYFLELSGRVAGLQTTTDLRCADFFSYDWARVASESRAPLLLLGNPPWVTSSQIGAINGANLPTKSNFQRLQGLDAKTGKANFDIAEWILIRLLGEFSRSKGHFAFLIKSSVARRVLRYAWLEKLPIADIEFLAIDALRHFGVSVDAGLLYCRLGAAAPETQCRVADFAKPAGKTAIFAIRGDRLTCDPLAFDRTAHLSAQRSGQLTYRWRSGVKHDCSRVLELVRSGRNLVNGYGKVVDIEDSVLYPLAKGSRLADCERPAHALVLPQTSVSEDPAALASSAPKAWNYLNRHAADFQARRSSIYRNRPLFSVFGIGPYTFAPWKIAISGLHKRLDFRLVPPVKGRPVVFDDTVYQLSMDSRAEAELILTLLGSDLAREYFESRVFWDAKRPITAELLCGLDIESLADKLGHREALALFPRRNVTTLFDSHSARRRATRSLGKSAKAAR